MKLSEVSPVYPRDDATGFSKAAKTKVPVIWACFITQL